MFFNHSIIFHMKSRCLYLSNDVSKSCICYFGITYGGYLQKYLNYHKKNVYDYVREKYSELFLNAKTQNLDLAGY